MKSIDKSRRICGSPYNDKHCTNLYYVTEHGTEINGKKLDIYCLYCIAGKKPKKIASMSSWTGLTPKWCEKLQRE